MERARICLITMSDCYRLYFHCVFSLLCSRQIGTHAIRKRYYLYTISNKKCQKTRKRISHELFLFPFLKQNLGLVSPLFCCSKSSSIVYNTASQCIPYIFIKLCKYDRKAQLCSFVFEFVNITRWQSATAHICHQRHQLFFLFKLAYFFQVHRERETDWFE